MPVLDTRVSILQSIHSLISSVGTHLTPHHRRRLHLLFTPPSHPNLAIPHPPLLHDRIDQPKLDSLFRRHVIIPLQRLFKPIFCRLHLFLRLTTMRHVYICQLITNP